MRLRMRAHIDPLSTDFATTREYPSTVPDRVEPDASDLPLRCDALCLTFNFNANGLPGSAGLGVRLAPVWTLEQQNRNFQCRKVRGVDVRIGSGLRRAYLVNGSRPSGNLVVTSHTAVALPDRVGRCNRKPETIDNSGRKL